MLYPVTYESASLKAKVFKFVSSGEGSSWIVKGVKPQRKCTHLCIWALYIHLVIKALNKVFGISGGWM